MRELFQTMAVMVVKQGANAGSEFPVEGDRFVLGRERDCQLHEPFTGVGGVSRHHACIVFSEGRYFVEDMGSRNGTFHNGQRLSGRVELAHGDRLSIAGTTLEFLTSAVSTDEPPSQLQQAPGAKSVAIDRHTEPIIDSAIPMPDRTSIASKVEDNAARKLTALVALLGKMGQSLDVDQIFDQFLEGLFAVFPGADHGVVAIRDLATGSIVPQAVRHRTYASSETAIHLSQTIVDRVLDAGEAILSANALTDERFSGSRSLANFDIHSLMCVPLIDRSGNCMGILQLDATGEDDRFNRQDLEVLASITPHAVTAMEYARLHEEELRQQSLRSDLEFARQIQRNFLPSRQPQIAGYDFFSYYEAAYHVGGDYYDYIDLAEGRLGIVVADVAGKGVSAALLMSKFAGELKYLLTREDSLGMAVTRMNNTLCADESMTRFITVAIAILDPKTGQVTLANAGHTDPLLRLADGSVKEVSDDEKGAPLGLFLGQEYEATRFTLGPGETLLMYTDGLSEATAADASLYGVDRIRQEMISGPGDVDELGSQIIRSAQAFVGQYPQSDDMCVICIQRGSKDA
jgi:sigma-B regulation protein RsbU (phosphoserine phosphatase)